MSKPQLHVGMVTMPVACTSLDEALGSATGMTGGSSNESQETIMGKMQNMTSTSGLNATKVIAYEDLEKLYRKIKK
jgi:hypothetical protein